MGVFITTQFQGIVGVSLAAMVLMRRQANPFAAEGGETERGAWSMERGGGKWGSAYARTSYGVTSGMPAPGVLAGLIEGELPEAGGEQGTGDGGQKGGVSVVQKDGISVGEGPRDVGTGGTVRTLPIRTPKRIASWMPRRIRAAVVAAARSAEETGDSEQGTAEAQNGSGVTRERPRQLAVPYQNYRRYRG
jgi:hypothetical protein